MPDYVNIVGLVSWKVNQAAITTAASQIANPALAGRKTISIKALTSNTVSIYVGADNTVTSSTGYELPAGGAIDMEISDVNAIWCIAGSGTQKACWAEVA